MMKMLPGLFCVTLLFIVGLGSLSLCGFSTTKLAFVSDQSFINAAIEDVLARYPPNLRTVSVLGDGKSVATYVPPEHPVPYEGAKQFMEINPSCCEFVERGSEGYQPSALSYLLGYEWRIVRVRYLLRYRSDKDGIQQSAVETYVVLSRDGRVFSPR